MSTLLARPYSEEDYNRIIELAQESNFEIDWAHLVDIVVVLREDKIIGFGSLHSILECIFTIDKNEPLKDRLELFSRAINAMDIATVKSGYKAVHAFVDHKQSVENTLVNRFGFQPCSGSFLVKHVL